VSSAAVRTGLRGLSDTFAQQALARPTKTFLWTPDETLTYAEADARVEAYAAGLQRRGVGPGDRVLLLMTNSAAQVLVWLALDRLGAVDVPVNTALSRGLLARAVRTVRPVLVIVDAELAADLAGALDGGEHASIATYVHGDVDLAQADLPAARPLTDLAADGSIAERPEPDELDPAVMLFTSGSTGVPKACVLSRRYVVRAGELHVKYLGLREDDVLFTPFPLFHIDAATLTVSAAIAAGATAALSRRFSASRFWDEVRASGATVFNFMGATANILWKRPPTVQDTRHAVRMAWGVPMPACEPGWQARFGFPLVEVYGLTDAGVPAYQDIHRPRVAGSCGRVIDEYDLRIGDEAGDPVPAGEVGEILLRGREPGLLMTEYFGMPEATEHAFRGGWFHTGDHAHVDADGNLFFASRAKEVIRRRGENIAASDVEAATDAHPAVRESAAVGVPSELSEDDIKVFVALQPGCHLTPEDVHEHCNSVLPKYMVPRYVEIVGRLPKTPTEKIERARLAAHPLNAATWDADARPRSP
jgi:crotonobetaine/carnitine-CoA ligase